MASDIFEDSIPRYDSLPAPGVDPYDFIVSREAERIGKRIRTIRSAMGLSQGQLGKMVGLNADRIQKYENGARKPKKELLKQIARALGVQTMAIADPIIAVNMDITVMYALFELEKRFVLDVDEDNAGQISITIPKDGGYDEIWNYLHAWYLAHKKYTYEHTCAETQSESEKAIMEYERWKWTFPDSISSEETQITTKRVQEIVDEIARLKRELEYYRNGVKPHN